MNIASCKNDLVGFEDMLIIFISSLIGIGGKGSKWAFENSTLP